MSCLPPFVSRLQRHRHHQPASKTLWPLSPLPLPPACPQRFGKFSRSLKPLARLLDVRSGVDSTAMGGDFHLALLRPRAGPWHHETRS